MPSRPKALVAATACALALTLLAFAQPAEGADVRVLVLITADDQGGGDARLEQAIAAHLHDLAPAFEIESVRADPNASAATAIVQARDTLGVMWLEPRRDDVSLFVARGHDGRVFGRRVPGAGGARLERVGIVARAIARALLDGADPGQEAVPAASASPSAEPQAAPAAAKPEPEAPTVVEPVVAARAFAVPSKNQSLLHQLRAVVGYTGVAPGSQAGWRSGATLGLSACFVPALCALAAYTFAGDDELPVADATIRVSHHPGEAALELRRVGRSITPFAQAGGYVDFTSRTTVAVPGALAATPPTSAVQAGLTAAVGGEWHIARRVAVRAAIGAECAIVGARYAVEGGQATAASPVRPRAGLAVVVGLW